MAHFLSFLMLPGPQGKKDMNFRPQNLKKFVKTIKGKQEENF
jgi:hypothetical protein